MGEGEMGREKGEGRTGESLRVGRCRWKTFLYRRREEDLYIKGPILGLARDLALVGIPVFMGISAARYLGSRGESA